MQLSDAKNWLDSSLIIANIQLFEKRKLVTKSSLQLPMDCELTLSMLRPNISGMKTKLIINRKNQLAFIWSKEGTGISYVLEENGERVITMKIILFRRKSKYCLILKSNLIPENL